MCNVSKQPALGVCDRISVFAHGDRHVSSCKTWNRVRACCTLPLHTTLSGGTREVGIGACQQAPGRQALVLVSKLQGGRHWCLPASTRRQALVLVSKHQGGRMRQAHDACRQAPRRQALVLVSKHLGKLLTFKLSLVSRGS